MKSLTLLVLTFFLNKENLMCGIVGYIGTKQAFLSLSRD